MEENDVDYQPTSIIKLPRAHEYAQLYQIFCSGAFFKVLVIDVMRMQSFMDILNKMSISNMKKTSLKDIRSLLS